MKLNLNFDKYKGVTRLPQWWREVKKHFEAVQTAFDEHCDANELDHPSKSVKQHHIDDYAISTQQIAQYAVTASKIYPAAVQTSHIKDGNVTKAKLDAELCILLDELKNFAPTYDLTFNDFEIDDVMFLHSSRGETTFKKVMEDGFLYYEDEKNCLTITSADRGTYLGANYFFLWRWNCKRKKRCIQRNAETYHKKSPQS